MNNSEFSRKLFPGTLKHSMVMPMDEPLNPFRRPDTHVKGVPPPKYVKEEAEAMSKSFMEIYRTLKD